ncbi:unnamed protein product [Adineta ricciae]|uniref:G-protein coupled receptors family 1 profile domain-containing protein n=1 Tax=Adineta ricciae TaxID=249248 RepID=A0A815RUZ5_ADIRI|nr:unnamed protein product [Adineta ricciae]
MFGFVHCNASVLARQNTDPTLLFVRLLVKDWLWPIITFFGVTGNILAVIVLTKRRMIVSSTNNYLIALALVDAAYLFLTLILNTLQNPCFTHRSFAQILLTICRPIADFSSNTSVWLTVTFTVERWVAISYPLQSRTWCTVHRARKIIFSVMCAAFLCTLPSAFEMKLIQIIEQKIIANRTTLVSRIGARPTMLGNSVLYHQIYFNFVTFAIIWIPLVLLLIFNTILISYVRRSKRKLQQNQDGIELRRHNRSSQSEQRKTTIMLIAVVIVFTVCQIPQAISLTVLSIFPTLARTSRVLIFNNFANCLVAVNASINFVLYCCFSERFRVTFRSNFTFLSKHCAQYIKPEWSKSTTRGYPCRNSFDDISQVGNSSPGPQLHTRVSNLSGDIHLKHMARFNSYQSQSFEENEQIWCLRFSLCTPKIKKSRQSSESKDTQFFPKPGSRTSTISSIKSPAHIVRQIPTFHFPSVASNRTLKVLIDRTEPDSRFADKQSPLIPSKQVSFSFSEVDRTVLKSRFHPKFYSYRSLSDKKQINEQIWIKRIRSEQDLNRRKSSFSKEILDVTV